MGGLLSPLERHGIDCMDRELLRIFYRIDHSLAEYDAFFVFSGQSLEARSRIHGVSYDSRIHPAFRSDRSDDHFSRIDPDPYVYLLSYARDLEPFDEVLDFDGAGEGVVRVLLFEDDHDTVPEELVYESAIFVNELSDPVEVDIEEEQGPFRTDLFADGGESHDIQEHDVELFAPGASEHDFLVPSESYLPKNVFRDEFREHLAQIVVIFFEEIVFDVAFFEEGFHFFILEKEMGGAFEIIGFLFFHSVPERFYETVMIVFVAFVEDDIDGDQYDIEDDVPDRSEVDEFPVREDEYENDEKNIAPEKREHKCFIDLLYTELHRVLGKGS